MGKMGPAWLFRAGRTRYHTKKCNIIKMAKHKRVQGRAWRRKQFNKRKVQTQLQKILVGKQLHLRGVLVHKKGPNWHKGNKQLLEKEKLELAQLKRELKRNKFNRDEY
ncbi:unnamed protein product [Paramecium octaurelia]|uniref:40S ribosomal protein S30 n=1 Tax=Paramecium octaurelia TaxID=43137 RepID=A0A8S1U7N7_PAROT|nr:unnamed protein product [Paramecium octaurelia]